jgi:hypothetical protein
MHSELKVDEALLTSGREEIQNDESGSYSSGPCRNPELGEHAAQVTYPIADGVNHKEGQDQKHYQRVSLDETSQARGREVEEQELAQVEFQMGQIGRDENHPSDTGEIEREQSFEWGPGRVRREPALRQNEFMNGQE